MLLEKYLGLRKLKLLKQKVESSTYILLKIMFYLFINKDCFKKYQNKKNKQELAIVIITRNEIEAKQFITNKL